MRGVTGRGLPWGMSPTNFLAVPRPEVCSHQVPFSRPLIEQHETVGLQKTIGRNQAARGQSCGRPEERVRFLHPPGGWPGRWRPGAETQCGSAGASHPPAGVPSSGSGGAWRSELIGQGGPEKLAPMPPEGMGEGARLVRRPLSAAVLDKRASTWSACALAPLCVMPPTAKVRAPTTDQFLLICERQSRCPWLIVSV